MIPEAAVEAAAKALYFYLDEDWRAAPDPWESLEDEDDGRIGAMRTARIALEAAAPHMRLGDVKTMTDVLVDHQRHKGGCLCGWANLGHSHPEHQAEALSAAGFGRVTR